MDCLGSVGLGRLRWLGCVAFVGWVRFGCIGCVGSVCRVGFGRVGLGWLGGWGRLGRLGCVGLCWVVLSRVLLGCIGLCCVTLDPEISVKGVRMGGGVENPSDYITPYRPGNFCVEFYGEIKFEPSERFWA